MNPQTVELILMLLGLGEKLCVNIRTVIEREKAGNPLSVEELAQLKAQSDQAGAVIDAWRPADGSSKNEDLPPDQLSPE